MKAAYLAALVALLVSTGASAQGMQSACAGDIATYCKGVQQGSGQLVGCLRQNQQKLSPQCQRGMQNAMGLMKEVVQACEDDMHRFCAGAAPGTAKECLRQNFRELSMGCKRELFEAAKQK
jgi:hypothetical protein